MSEASEILANALQRAEQRAATTPRIDYARMRKVFPKQKAALTRAKNKGDIEKAVLVVKAAVKEWDEIGAWPDDWSLFQRTLNDMLPWHQQVDIRDL